MKIQVMADVENAFLPLPPKEVLIPLSNSESMTMLDVILTRILQLYIHNSNSSIAFGAAISVAVDALLSSGGKIFSTVSGIPSVGQGSLEDREDSKVIGTATESRLFNPQDSFYPILATRMAESAISLDLFIGANSYVDVASIGSLCKTSGGQVYFYSGFHISKNGFSLEADFYRAVSRESIFDGIMVLRTSAGLKVVEQFGNFFRRNAGEMDLPTCDSDKTFAVKIGFESKLSTETPAVFQNAVLYTNIRGERRIRVHTLSLPVVNSTSQVFKHADVDSVVNFSLRNVINHVSNSTISDCRKILRENCTEILYTYRKHCAQQTSSGHLILPEALKLLPLYTIGIMKNPILADYTDSDERNFLFGYANTMPLSVAISFCSPRLYALHRLPPESCVYREDGYFQYPPLQIVSAEFLDEAGIYLLDNGLVLSVWVGPEADPSQVREIFGLEDDISLEQMDFYQLQVVPDNSDASALSSKVYTLMETLRYYRPIYNPTVVITRSNLQESLDVQKFMNSLVEDAVELAKGEKPIGPEADRMSYVDFLCYLHRKIQDRFL